jgi:diacylglycerol O-acyltransferase
MTRLSALDASFLRVETPAAHMHVGWIATLELPPGRDTLDVQGLVSRIAGRLHLAPRFRQRVTGAPLGLGEAMWTDDPGFDLRNHLQILDGRHPLNAAGLQRVAGEFFSEQLVRERPLWRIAVVPRLRGGRAAVLGKVHHAMVDGVAAVELGMVLFDLTPEAELPQPLEWAPDTGQGGLRIVAESVADGCLEQYRNARRAVSLGISPRRTLRVAETMRRAALSLAEDALRAAPSSYLNVAIGPRRTVVTHRMAMKRLAAVKQRCGVKLNDAALAVVAGALRRLAARRGEEQRDLRVMVPVSVRSPEQSGGNRITFAFLDLPVAEPDAFRRLLAIRAQTLAIKGSGRIEGTDMLLRSVALLPGPVKEKAARLAASPRMYNLTVSNVPGPTVPLYAAGAKVRSIYPIVPIPEGHALSIGVLSYGDHLHLSAYADPDALPGLSPLSILLEDSLAELEIVTSARPRLRVLPPGSDGLQQPDCQALPAPAWLPEGNRAIGPAGQAGPA